MDYLYGALKSLLKGCAELIRADSLVAATPPAGFVMHPTLLPNQVTSEGPTASAAPSGASAFERTSEYKSTLRAVEQQYGYWLELGFNLRQVRDYEEASILAHRLAWVRPLEAAQASSLWNNLIYHSFYGCDALMYEALSSVAIANYAAQLVANDAERRAPGILLELSGASIALPTEIIEAPVEKEEQLRPSPVVDQGTSELHRKLTDAKCDLLSALNRMAEETNVHASQIADLTAPYWKRLDPATLEVLKQQPAEAADVHGMVAGIDAQLRAAEAGQGPVARPGGMVLSEGSMWAAVTERTRFGTPERAEDVRLCPRYDPFPHLPCCMKILNVAEFRRVEQTLVRYEASEIASIVNVMQGEYQQRTTCRSVKTEESFLTRTETETTHETDTNFAERYEMESAMKRETEASLDVKFDGKVWGKYGTVTTKSSPTESPTSSASRLGIMSTGGV